MVSYLRTTFLWLKENDSLLLTTTRILGRKEIVLLIYVSDFHFLSYKHTTSGHFVKQFSDSAGWFSRCTYFNANGRYYSTGIDTANKRDGIYWAKYPVNLRPVDPSNRAKRVGSYYWTMKSTKISILVNPNQK